jgi:thymidylate synthase
MNEPITINEESFQKAWVEAAKILVEKSWAIHNLVVTIKNTTIFDQTLNKRFVSFADNNGLKRPRIVACTIFPQKLYDRCGDAKELFEAYNKPRGLYDRSKRPTDWGSYFRRMTYYSTPNGIQNQLGNIINTINKRNNTWKASYTIIIQKPGKETIRARGGPCLNYLAVQLNPNGKKLGVLAVYRSHDFFERAYGNYWGLCNLINFIAKETTFNPGFLTCVSSRAFVDGNQGNFKNFLLSL